MASTTYEERAARHPNACAKQLLTTIAEKQSNLCVSVDVTRKEDLLEIVDTVGPFVALVKTHIDIVEDFDWDLIEQLSALSIKHKFLIFEDRKFADIGTSRRVAPLSTHTQETRSVCSTRPVCTASHTGRTSPTRT